MLALKIILCVLSFIGSALIGSEREEGTRKGVIISSIITTVLAISFCILIVITRWNIFAIPKMILFVTVCMFLISDKYVVDFYALIFMIGFVATIIAYIIAGVKWSNNVIFSDVPEVTTTSQEIMCAKDSFSVSGSVQGGVFYISGSISEKPIYRYYYQVDNGGIKLGSIDANSTTIYLISDEEVPHLDTIVSVYYKTNYNKEPAVKEEAKTEIRYELYVPKGAVISIYEFDAE